MPTVALTDRFCSTAKPTGGKRTDYFDTTAQGLALRVTEHGRRSWCFHYRSPRDGKRARATLGSYPGTSLAAARGKALRQIITEAYEVGKKIFFYRAGPHDFGCVTCHGADNQRIRLQDLPNLTKTSDSQRAYGSWPAYRVSQGELRSFQWRPNDCFRQQRFPELEFVSPASIALTMFLARNANGGVFDAPSIKR